jgi:hypothetical protein
VESAIEIMGLIGWLLVGGFVVTRIFLALARRKKLNLQNQV